MAVPLFPPKIPQFPFLGYTLFSTCRSFRAEALSGPRRLRQPTFALFLPDPMLSFLISSSPCLLWVERNSTQPLVLQALKPLPLKSARNFFRDVTLEWPPRCHDGPTPFPSRGIPLMEFPSPPRCMPQKRTDSTKVSFAGRARPILPFLWRWENLLAK